MKSIATLLLASAVSLWTLHPALQQGAVPGVGPGADVPVGTILAFWGDENDLPDGWEACDGSAVEARDALLRGPKPDLRERFLRGTKTASTYKARAYPKGGAATGSGTTDPHVLTVAEMPSHDHGIGTHRHDIPPATLAHTHTTPDHSHQISANAHTHPLPGQTTSAAAPGGGGGQVNNLHQTTGNGSLDTSGNTVFSTDTDGGGTTTGITFTSKPATGSASGQTASTGGSQGHAHALKNLNLLPPYFEIIWIIKVK